MNHSTTEVDVVSAWHEALNNGDTDRLVALSHEDVEMGGPRGVVSGAEALCEWVVRANILLKPQRIFQREDTVVVEQEAEWRSLETSEVVGEDTVGSIFVVRDGRVASITRYPSLADALSSANLDESSGTNTGHTLERGD